MQNFAGNWSHCVHRRWNQMYIKMKHILTIKNENLLKWDAISNFVKCCTVLKIANSSIFYWDFFFFFLTNRFHTVYCVGCNMEHFNLSNGSLFLALSYYYFFTIIIIIFFFSVELFWFITELSGLSSLHCHKVVFVRQHNCHEF